jgi:hypothetical protein
MFYHGNFWEITLYTNGYKKLKYAQTKEKILHLLASSCCCVNSILLQGKRCNLSNSNIADTISNTQDGRAIPYHRNNSRHPVSPFSYRHFIHTFFIRPKLRIENPKVEVHNEGSQSEFKDAYFDIHNIGRRSVSNGKVKVRVKGLWDDFKIVAYNFPSETQPFNLDPDDKLRIRLCEFRKKDKAIVIHTIGEFPTLEIGQTYDLEIRFAGKNFTDRKIRKLQLDLTSYENFGLTES